MKFRHILALVFACALLLPSLASAAPTTEVVTEGDVTRQVENTPPLDDWVLYTRAGTPPIAGAFVDGPGTPPNPTGSFQTTTATGSEKVFLFNYEHIGTPLADVDDISYNTYRQSGSAQQVAALNLQVDYNGAASGGFTTLVFEPVYNTAQGAVVSGSWQDWIADGSGRWWSTQPINGQCAGASGPCFRTWDQIVANNPDAVITGGVGINQGSGNPGLVTNTDAFTFDETTYDFEADDDSDGVGNGSDNCVDDANPDQADEDGDGIGTACDNDLDNDGVDNGPDNCDTTANADQADADGDDIGDVCDSDRDGDDVANEDDNCADAANTDQADADGDEIGDVCDPDSDGDGVANGPDNCDTVPNPGQEDADGDGIGTACENQQERPASKDDCKNGGWQTYTTGNPAKPAYKNQGDCVSSFAPGKAKP